MYAKIFISWGNTGECIYHHPPKFHNFILHWRLDKKFFTCDFWKKLCFLRVKIFFLSQGVCTLKFLFFEGLQRHVFTIIHQGFTILACTIAVLEFFVNSYKFVFIYILLTFVLALFRVLCRWKIEIMPAIQAIGCAIKWVVEVL